tara:strand:+ start:528 stop:2498 length:1971 start_codon:yes stop_codon:yes gene_type:complete
MGLLPNYRGTPYAGAIKLDEEERVKLEELKEIISRADNPFAAYQTELMSRGLGSGSVFQEEGPGLGISSRTSNAMQDARPVSEGGKRSRNQFSSEELTKKLIQNLGRDEEERNSSVNMPSTLSGIEYALDQIEKAGSSSDDSEAPLTTLAKRQLQNKEFDVAESRLNSLMESGSESFDDSPLDAIAAQIERARLSPLVGSSRPDTQSIIADNPIDAVADAAAEEFRADEAELFDDTSLTIAEGDKISEDTFKAAMDGFLGSARGASPDKREKTLAEYKKEFAAATGVDVSGKVDKSQALMAMGLALMQNRAGKGFNVGKLLNAVGQAGEKALPSLEKAKTEAKKAGLAAGQYALQSRNSDQAKDEANVEKGRQRSAFYIVPKGKGVSGFIANIDQGQLENLNPFELDALMSNKSFQEAFDVVPGSTWSGIVEEAMKTKEAGVYWDTKAPRKIELFGEGAGDMFTIEAWRALPQSGKDNKLVGSGQDAYEGLARAARDMGKARDKFSSAFGLIEGTTAFRFTLDKVDSLAAAFGVNFKEGTNKTEKLKLFLTKLQAQNAKEILGEAGKTISDADRALVKTIVGDVDLFQNTELLEQKVTELFQEIIVKKEQNILDALTTLDRYSGRRIASRLNNGELDEAGYAELQGYLASPAFKEN